MEQATIVPHDRITWGPGVLIGPRWLAGEVDELLQESFGLLGVHARDSVRMPPDQQRRAAGFGMSLHQRPEWSFRIVEAVADVLAVRARRVTQLGLAVVQRVRPRVLQCDYASTRRALHTPRACRPIPFRRRPAERHGL